MKFPLFLFPKSVPGVSGNTATFVMDIYDEVRCSIRHLPRMRLLRGARSVVCLDPVSDHRKGDARVSFRVFLFELGGRAARFSLGGVACALLLAGCAGSSHDNVQVVEGSPTVPHVTSGQHVVSRGESISSIAVRYGWDWRELAALNGISAPYVIYPGQTIRFSSASQPASTGTPTGPSVTPAVVAAPLKSSDGKTRTNAASVAPGAQTAAPEPARSSSGWSWPAEGPLVGRFSSNGSLNKGIDIGGQLGQPVVAASDGAVVYAGGGLRGYGELVIIKHSDIYVTAYGHNRKLLVREGQQVKAGQVIAEMGSTGTDRVKLHFEIRRQGKPVDPLRYLPSR